MANIKSLTKDINGILSYLTEKLNWPIEVDNPEYASEEATWEYYPEAIGLSDSDFAKIKQLLQLRPLTGDQEWACFFVIFDESPRMSITAMRKILGALIYQKRNADDHKIWDKNNLLFVCQWGTKLEREIGFVHFDDSEKSLPTLKDFCFKTNGQDEQYLSNAEDRLKNLYWKFEGKVPEWTENWKRTFTTVHGQVIHDTEILTKELAKVAKTVQSRILEVFEIENEKGYVNRLFKKFKTNLVHDMSKEQFADMYAQTIAYGLFSARCLNPEESEFDPIRAIENIPNTNPFLRDLLKEGFAEKKNTLVIDELDLNSVVDLLKNTDISSIVQDFNKQSRNGREDPVIHFYEDFLTEYDRETRMDRGVFYTPVPVVDFIVRSVDQILKTEFGIEDGLACDETIETGKGKDKKKVPKVQILDPATGTGTFLRQTILLIKKNFDEKNRALNEKERARKWNEYVIVSLLHRLFGFELMMAPYAVAHMKLAMALKETGYNFGSASRLKVFLTNSLEEPGSTEGPSLFDIDPIAAESTQANKVKKESQINVIIGNPPYSGVSSNNGDWIEKLVEDYKFIDGCSINERKTWYKNDYCKFIRYATHILEREEKGILAFINDNSYLDGPTFRGMRWNLLNSFDEIYILNLHGSSKRKDVTSDGKKDENVFDIQQGVCINIFIKLYNNEKERNTKFYYKEFYGGRLEKLSILKNLDFSKSLFSELVPKKISIYSQM